MNGGRPSSASADTIPTNIQVGEADAGLVVDTSILGNPDEPFTMTPERREYIFTTLPNISILKARTTAYKMHNGRLESQAKALKAQSSELERQLRKVVALSTGVEEERVDGMIDGLMAAVASEGGDDVEVGRVREFLRRVESGGEC